MHQTEIFLMKQIEKYKAQVERVRELHQPINGPADDTTCKACVIDEDNYPTYPCPTVKALDGEQ